MDPRVRDAVLMATGAGAGAVVTAALASLVAGRPAQAATDQEKLDYLIQLSELQTAGFAALSESLDVLNSTMHDIREINGLDFAFDPMRYIVWKLRSGEGYAVRVSYFQVVAPAATFTFTTAMAEGYVFIGIRAGIEVSQNGVFGMIQTVDGGALPWLVIPRLATGEFNWAETLPFGFVVKNSSVIAYTNNDAANQWLIGAFYGIFLRNDVWERDSKLMDRAAQKYSSPPEVNFGE